MERIMSYFKKVRFLFFSGFVLISLISCEGMPGGDARENPPNPELRVKKNLEEGRGFRLDTAIKDNFGKGGDFLFASANELWRASLDTIDFMPLNSADQVGGTIITDWYSTENNQRERCKLNIFITGKKLNTENLRVASFCQEFNDIMWVNTKTEKENNIKIENAILNKAKKLKLQSS